MTIEEAIKELCDWLEQMIQSGVPSHSAKRKTLAYAISALLDIDCMIAETEIHGLSRNWVNDLKKLIEPYSYTVPIKTDDKPIGEFDAITGTVTYYGKTRPSDITHTIYKEAEPSDTFVCPMCADCPDGCPLDKEKESTIKEDQPKTVDVKFASTQIQLMPNKKPVLEFVLSKDFEKVYLSIGGSNYICNKKLASWESEPLNIKEAGVYDAEITSNNFVAREKITFIKGLEEEDLGL